MVADFTADFWLETMGLSEERQNTLTTNQVADEGALVDNADGNSFYWDFL